MKMWTVGFPAAGGLWQTQTSQKGLLGPPDLSRQEGSPPQGQPLPPSCVCVPVPGRANQLAGWLSPKGIKEHSYDFLLTVRLKVL